MREVHLLNDPTLAQVLAEAQSLPMWILSIAVVGFVVFQAFLFSNLALRYSRKTKVISDQEIKTAIRAGAIAALGPSLGVFLVSTGLITQIGGAVTFMRVGVIGSAPYELTAASLGAKAFGVELGGPGFNYQAMTNVVWAMSLGGCGWLIVSGLGIKPMSMAQSKLTAGDPRILGLIGTTAGLGTYSNMLGEQLVAGKPFIVAFLIAGVIMAAMRTMSKKLKMGWIQEWALGVAMVISMVLATIIFG